MTLNMPGTIGGATVTFSNLEYRQEKIGIIGLGYVGNAIRESMEGSTLSLVLLDPAKQLTATYEELAECSGIFICVPSPQNSDGSCDTSILDYVLEHLDKVKYKGVIISTQHKGVLPDNRWHQNIGKNSFVMCTAS